MSRSPIPPLYLPITAAKAAEFFDQGQVPSLPVEQAALFVVLAHLETPLSEAALQTMLIQAQKLFMAQPEQGAMALAGRRTSSALDAVGVRRQLASAAMTYAPEEKMFAEAWRDEDGLYSFEFQQACRGSMQEFDIRLSAPMVDDAVDPDNAVRAPQRRATTTGTRDQHVAASIIGTADGEHVHISAYAGTGKTHLVHTMTGVLSQSFTYIAPSEGHLFGFQQAVKLSGNTVRAVHLWRLAHELARINAQRLALGFQPQRVSSTYSTEDQARFLSIQTMGRDSPGQVVALCHRIIKSWCHTEAPLLTLRDVHRLAPGNTVNAASLLATCQFIWEQMFKRHPMRGNLYTVDIVHMAKWLMVTGARIPASYGTLIVDEAHDLQLAWQYLFSRYEGGCVLLGDPNQCLRGQPRPQRGAKNVWMGQSVRIGNGVEQLISTSLALGGNDPGAVEFSTSRAHITARRPYQSSVDSPLEGLRVFGDPNALLAYLLEAPASTGALALLPATAREIKRHSLVLIDEYRQHKARTGQRWQSTAARLAHSGHGTLVARIEAGLGNAELDAVLSRHADASNAVLLLGLVEHAKNLEADVVTLAPCCFGSSIEQRHYHPARAVYQAMTRAKHELWLPGDGMDRLSSRLATSRT